MNKPCTNVYSPGDLDHLNPFAMRIVQNIRETILEQRADGIIGMTRENLLQVTPTPARTLRGAPMGLNAPFYYRTTFFHLLDGIIRHEPEFSDFIFSS